MFTLENRNNDCIRKENGKWGFFRNLPYAEFGTRPEAMQALKEMKSQGLEIKDIKIVEW